MWTKDIDSENEETIQEQEKFEKNEMAKKAKKNTERQKKKNKWIEMNKRRELRGKTDIQKREHVALVVMKVEFFFSKKRKFQKKSAQIFNEKSFS